MSDLVNPYLEGPKCTRYRPDVMCLSRRVAMSDGSMFFSHRHGGWIFPAEDRRLPRSLREKALAPFVWDVACPFCGGALPTVESAVDKLLSPPPPAPDTTEDGG